MQVTNVACPSCLPAVTSYMANQPGTYEMFCVNPATKAKGPHAWDDRETFNNVLAAAKIMYPAQYAGPKTAAPVVASKDIYVDPETKKAMEEIVKQPLTGAGDLKGILFEAMNRADDAEKELVKLRATVEVMKKHRGSNVPAGTLAPNQCIITIPEWAESEVDNFAEHEGKTRGEWISETVEQYLESYCTQKQEA